MVDPDQVSKGRNVPFHAGLPADQLAALAVAGGQIHPLAPGLFVLGAAEQGNLLRVVGGVVGQLRQHGGFGVVAVLIPVSDFDTVGGAVVVHHIINIKLAHIGHAKQLRRRFYQLVPD